MSHQVQYFVKFKPTFDATDHSMNEFSRLSLYFSFQDIFTAAAKEFSTAYIIEIKDVDVESFCIKLNAYQISLIPEEILRSNIKFEGDSAEIKHVVEVPLDIFSKFCTVCCEAVDSDEPDRVICRLALLSSSLLKEWLSQNCPEKIEQISSNSVDWLKRRFKLISMDDLIYVKFTEDGLRIAQERCETEDATDDDGVTEMSLKDLFENLGDVLSQNSLNMFEGGGIFISNKNLIKNTCET